MGILNGSRINFWGGIQTNVCTANNTQTPGGKDILDLVNATIVGDLTDDEMIEWFRTPAYTKNGEPAFTESGWNYYGDHLVNSVDAKISSEGPAGNMVTDGSLANQPVYLLGSLDPVTGQGPFFGPVMVDLDPTSGVTTQIFFGGLQIGTNEDIKLLIRHNAVCSSHSLDLRILNGETDSPGSSKINGTFQLTFPLSSIVQHDTSCKTLEAIIKDPKATGIVLRFSMFEMAPYMTTPEQLADFQANRNSSNPSSGRVIGTLGPAYEGEWDTCPPGRLLQNQTGGATGFAQVHDDFLSLDTVSLMLKENFRADRTDFTGPIGPNIKFDSLDVSAGSEVIGSYDPLSEDYYLYGGIIDVPVDTSQKKEALATSPIEIIGHQAVSGSDQGNSVSISEIPLRIDSNDRNIYLEDIAGTPDRICGVSYLGGPLPSDTNFAINSYSSGTLPNPRFLTFSKCAHAKAGDSTISFSVEDNGSGRAGFEQLQISLGTSAYFINFRRYPETDFGIPAGSTVTWDQAYDNVLRFFYIVFPAMSKRIPLNFEDSIKATGPQILARTSEEYRDTTLYMPIVRSMTPSQVKLLRAFLTNTPWNP
ncbi:MAG: hypothetical protein ACR2PT_23160 [Endozoicomonas sp.]